MKGLGYLLITLGFLAGTVVAVQTAENRVDWNWFLPAFAIGVAGVVLARVGSRRESRQETKLTGDFAALTASLDRLVENLGQLDATKESLNPYDVHPRIDELLRDDLNTFAEGRESIAHLYGLSTYAEVMNDFAAGERYVNRVWSASVDGWIDEVHEYLARADRQFRAAQEKLRTLQQS